MAVIDFLNTFRIQADEPIDSRFVLADEAARFSYPTGALYEGLIVYQLDTKVLWTLVDKNASSEASGWSRETSDDIVSIVASDVKSNGFRDLVFTFESGKVITIENAFREAEKGDKGDTGATGARGEKGDTGSQGLMGEQGLPGIDGINGINGTNGTDGTDGADGAQGARGEQGLPGTNGADGTDGMDGAQGAPGTNGTDGSDGPAGQDGAMGEKGNPGSDASVTKANVDAALEIGDASQDFYYNNDGNWVKLLDPTKGQIDDAIGATPGTNDPTRFYAEDGQFRTPAGGGGGTGTNVVANPNTISTDTLNTIEVGSTTYDLPSGGGGGAADEVTTQAGGGPVEDWKIWIGTKAQYNALLAVDDIDDAIQYNITDDSSGGGGGGTSTTVLGTADEIDVVTVDDVATVSLDPQVTGAISTNTSNISFNATGIANNASDIATNVTSIGTNATDIATNVTAIALNTAKTGITTTQSDAITANTAKNSYPTADSNKLAGIETGADVTDTDNVVGSLTAGNNITIAADGTISSTGGGGGGTSDYDDLTNAPIDRLRTVETIVLGGTRTNVVDFVEGTNEFSTITLLDSFDSSAISTNFDTSADLVYHIQLVAAGRWQFANSVGFVNGMVIADGTDWSTLDGVYLADSTLSGGTGIGNQVAVNDVIRITIGQGFATFTVTEAGNSSVVSFIRLSNPTNITGTINGISTSGNTISFDAGIFTQEGASFSYTPDTDGTVYTSSITDQLWETGSNDITTNLTYVANQIAALETDITWDGVITSIPEVSTSFTTGATTFETSSNPLNAVRWTILKTDNVPTVGLGDAWSTLDNMRIVENENATAPMYNDVNVGDRVSIALGSLGSASFIVTNKQLNANDHLETTFGVAESIIGTIGTSLFNGVMVTLAFSIITMEATSSITLDLGTNTNINSSFTITNGIDNDETVVNTDGAPSTGSSVATTITIIDADGMEITSFTSSVPSTSTNNVDVVGQQIADAVNSNTETPIDFTATYNSVANAIILTAAAAGDTDPWTVTFNNNNATGLSAGNITVISQTQDGDVINQLDGSIITFSNGSQTIALPSPPATGTVTLQSVDGVLSWS